MSVAFRRDSDEEHLEPTFELPIPPGPNLVTAPGLTQIQSKVAEFETLVQGLQDDTAIKAARRELRYWIIRQATARLMDKPDGSCVAFGCGVTFVMNGKQRTITIVGDDEADPVAGMLSFSAPLSRAMLDAEVGDKLDFAGRSEAIEIIAIGIPTG